MFGILWLFDQYVSFWLFWPVWAVLLISCTFLFWLLIPSSTVQLFYQFLLEFWPVLFLLAWHALFFSPNKSSWKHGIVHFQLSVWDNSTFACAVVHVCVSVRVSVFLPWPESNSGSSGHSQSGACMVCVPAITGHMRIISWMWSISFSFLTDFWTT